MDWPTALSCIAMLLSAYAAYIAHRANLMVVQLCSEMGGRKWSIGPYQGVQKVGRLNDAPFKGARAPMAVNTWLTEKNDGRTT